MSTTQDERDGVPADGDVGAASAEVNTLQQPAEGTDAAGLEGGADQAGTDAEQAAPGDGGEAGGEYGTAEAAPEQLGTAGEEDGASEGVGASQMDNEEGEEGASVGGGVAAEAAAVHDGVASSGGMEGAQPSPRVQHQDNGSASAAGLSDSQRQALASAESRRDGDAPAALALSPRDSAGSRPLSALRDLRGSRPNSAAIAAQIEGFEADFLADVEPLDDVPEGVSDDGLGDGDTTERSGPTAEELAARAQQEQRRLTEQNQALQRQARVVLEERAKGRPPVAKDLAHLEGADARYRGALKQWSELLEERRRVQEHYNTTVFDMKVALEARIRRAEEISGAFAEFKRQVALSSQFNRSGRPLGEHALQQLEERERVAEEAVQRARLKNVHLANSLKKLEALLRSREQLAEGLHLIDFEQLKIENQSLSEKIEERNEELVKLGKKNTNMVQVLTHMKEKAAFVKKSNAASRADRAALDSELQAKRDSLARLRGKRDSMRATGARLKETCYYVTSPLLLADLAAQKERKNDLMAELEELKRQDAVAAAAAAAVAAAASAEPGSVGRRVSTGGKRVASLLGPQQSPEATGVVAAALDQRFPLSLE